MRRIHIDKIQDGQILAKPVVDDFSNVILNTGFVLSRAWTDRLKLRKVEFIFVDDEAASPSAAPATAVSHEEKVKLAAEVSAAVTQQFSRVMNDEIMQVLAEAAKRYRLRKRLSGPA